MILSALLTSVGINFALCLLFFILYSVLRNRPSYADFYIPRLVAEGKFQEDDEFSVGKLLSSFKWVKRACQPSEEELLANSGLDAVVFMRIFTFGLKVFRFAGIVGICILLPFNYMGNQLNIDFTDLPNKSLESFSISNVDDGSNSFSPLPYNMAFHIQQLGCGFMHGVYVEIDHKLFFILQEYDYIASKRIAYFYSSKPRPGQFTVLVRSIPATSGRSFSESVESFFSEYYPSTYLSHSVVRRTSKLRGLVNEADKVYKRLVHVKSKKHPQQRFKRAGFMGLFGRKVDLLDHYEKKLEDVEGNVRTERSSIAGKEVPAAFVSFKSRFSAAIVSHVQQGVKPTEWITEQAPDPQDVYWPFFSASFIKRWFANIVVIFACIFVTVLFLVPVLLVQGLTHLDQLEVWLPFLRGILNLKIVSQVITGYFPSLILEMFLSLVPPVMIVLSSIQGYIALSQIEKSACIKVLWFTIWNIFFANVLSGSALYRVDVFLEPKRIPELLAVAVPGQLLNVYAPKFETGGKFWPVVHDATIFSLILMHVIAIGIFGLKKVPLASSLAIPLPILTLIFNSYCRRRFRPSFKGYPAEVICHSSLTYYLKLLNYIHHVAILIAVCSFKILDCLSTEYTPSAVMIQCLINKDRFDQSDPTISSFYDELATAYRDPAMKSVRYSEARESSSSPLLYGADK
ncbi:UNVERIFIED_CONTAM: CSC1-like protein HYP1 [Sesamum radiatum]|uniref:CSC1-like protein HYP1 n=1 Tax=Sesamum radiatum TaxID=300843 RepID=A0AAW2P695_SESRA